MATRKVFEFLRPRKNRFIDLRTQRTCSSRRRRGQIWRGEMKTREITWHGQMFGTCVNKSFSRIFSLTHTQQNQISPLHVASILNFSTLILCPSTICCTIFNRSLLTLLILLVTGVGTTDGATGGTPPTPPPAGSFISS